MLYHKTVSCTYFWYIINLSIDILCFIFYRLNKRNCDKNDCDCKMREFQESTQGLVVNLLEQEKLLLRFCPCYCVNFLMDDQLNWLNKDWLDKWNGFPILREATAATTRQGLEIQVLDHNMALQIVDLFGKDSTVAIASIDDPMYYFYAMKDISDGE